MMQTAQRKMGNSEGVILPKAARTELRTVTGTKFDVRVEDRSIILTPVAEDPRKLWAAELQAAADAGELEPTEDEIAWRSFGTAFDAEWEW